MTILRMFVLSHDGARHGCSNFALAAPAGTVVRFSEPTRDSAINAALHAKLGEIAAQHVWCDRKWPPEVWKRLLTAAWCRATQQEVLMIPALDGAGVDIVFRRTSELTQAECRDLLAFIEAWEAETEAAA